MEVKVVVDLQGGAGITNYPPEYGEMNIRKLFKEHGEVVSVPTCRLRGEEGEDRGGGQAPAGSSWKLSLTCLSITSKSGGVEPELENSIDQLRLQQLTNSRWLGPLRRRMKILLEMA